MTRLLFLVFAAIMLPGCDTGASSGCPRGQTCIRSGILSDPGSLDPARSFVKQDQTVIIDLLHGLVTYSADGQLIPGLAESWSVSPDELTWTFRLRDAVWSDGVPITADDIVYSLRRLVDPATGASYANLVYPIINAEDINTGRAAPDSLGVSAPDPMTVIIRLAHPTPYLLAVLAHYGVVPVPPHAIKRWGDQWTSPTNFVSSGPFRLAQWRLGDRLTLIKNSRFYDADNVCLDRVDYFPTPNVVLAERRVRRGELDLHPAYDAARRNYLKSPQGMPEFVQSYPWTHLVYVAFSLERPALQDTRVRRALAMSIDREFIANRLLDGEPTASFVPPVIALLPVEPSWASGSLAQRKDLARRLLAQAGYGPERPLRVTLKSIIGLGVPVTIAADWRDIGVEVQQARTDVAVFFNDLVLGDFDVAYTDWIADYPDPTNFLNQLRRGHPANYPGFFDPKFERMMRSAEREADEGRRAQLLQRAELQALESAPVAPIFVNRSHNLVHPDITGWENNLEDVHSMRWICWRGADQRRSKGATQ